MGDTLIDTLVAGDTFGEAVSQKVYHQSFV
jgi:hypothetical protein